jgi:ABC-type multidrug transport system fused ATPase/permease subunit
MNADRILVMAEGQVINIGQHQWLMEHEPLYREMVKLQFNQPRLPEVRLGH